MGLHSGKADWVAGLSFANVSKYFVTFITLNTDTDTDTDNYWCRDFLLICCWDLGMCTMHGRKKIIKKV